jgi:hypothetical protein
MNTLPEIKCLQLFIKRLEEKYHFETGFEQWETIEEKNQIFMFIMPLDRKAFIREINPSSYKFVINCSIVICWEKEKKNLKIVKSRFGELDELANEFVPFLKELQFSYTLPLAMQIYYYNHRLRHMLKVLGR